MLIKTLERVDSEYVIIFLDDNFVNAPVDVKGFERMFERFKKDKHCAYIVFGHNVYPGDKDDPSLLYRDYDVIPRIRSVQHSANASLWRKSKLLSYLREGESAWEFECNSKKRRALLDRAYFIKKGKSPIPTTYIVSDGLGIRWGKWLWNNERLFASNDIHVDFSKRGVVSEADIDKYLAERRVRLETNRKKSWKLKSHDKLALFKDSMPDELIQKLRIIKHMGRK